MMYFNSPFEMEGGFTRANREGSNPITFIGMYTNI